jgi:hypothetical protein
MDMKLGSTYQHDKDIIKGIEALADNRTFMEIQQNFPAYVSRILLTRFLAYYELFKIIQSKPGWIVECGVYRGFSFFSLGKFLEIFCMGDKTRKILGFESFEGFSELSTEDGEENTAVTRMKGGTNPSDFEDDFFKLLKLNNLDAFAPWVERMQIVKGDARQTIPKYVKENPGLRISLLHIDIDIYEPVSVALDNLYPLVIPGGVVVLDEYAHQNWPGESAAFEHYFRKNNLPVPELKTFGWCGTPTTYFIKEHFQ